MGKQLIVLGADFSLNSIDGQGGGLPAEYQRVEYLESTDGKPYIRTGVSGGNSPKLFIDYAITDTRDNYNVFGGDRPNSTDSAFFMNVVNSGLNSLCMNGTNIRVGQGAAGSRHTIMYDGANVSVDDGIPSAFPLHDTWGSTEMSIFTTTLYTAYGAKCRFYSVIMWNGDVKIRDFIPCYRKADNVAGMFDMVGKIFYTNANTQGTFAVGADVDE